MENSSEFFGLQYRGRSISLPSRLQHPNSIKIESLLSKLKSFKSESLTGDTVQCGLVGLVELQNCLEEFMESSPTSHFTLVHYPCRLIMEDTLKRSMEILDSAGLIRDLCLTIKEHVHLLQSALRRKNGDSSVQKDIKAYFHFRKTVKKEASKILTVLKRMESRSETALSLHTDQNRAVIIRVLRESNAIAIGVLRSLLMYLSFLPCSRFKQGGKFLFAIFTRLKMVGFERGQDFSDVGCVDFVLDQHIRNNESKDCLQLARTSLQILDTRIEALENGLEHLFRGLVRNQVNLLNIFNH